MDARLSNSPRWWAAARARAIWAAIGTSTTGVSGLSLAADVYPVWNPMVRCDCHNGGAGGLSMGTPEDAYMELVGVPANGIGAPVELTRPRPGEVC